MSCIGCSTRLGTGARGGASGVGCAQHAAHGQRAWLARAARAGAARWRRRAARGRPTARGSPCVSSSCGSQPAGTRRQARRRARPASRRAAATRRRGARGARRRRRPARRTAAAGMFGGQQQVGRAVSARLPAGVGQRELLDPASGLRLPAAPRRRTASDWRSTSSRPAMSRRGAAVSLVSGFQRAVAVEDVRLHVHRDLGQQVGARQVQVAQRAVARRHRVAHRVVGAVAAGARGLRVVERDLGQRGGVDALAVDDALVQLLPLEAGGGHLGVAVLDQVGLPAVDHLGRQLLDAAHRQVGDG